MLRELLIEDLAIIEGAKITFGPGLNVLTGETGAGKSLLVGALELVLGHRARSEWVRAGADEARVEAVIELEDAPEINALLAEAGYPEEEMLVLRRTVSRAGKGRVHVNDRASTLGFLERLGRRLVDIHGQHEHQSLLRPARHRDLVDRFGKLEPLREEVAALHGALLGMQRELARLEEEHRRATSEKDLAVYQLEEITRARLRPGEEEELEEDRKRLLHAERLLEASLEAERVLYSDQESLVDRLGRVRARIEEASDLDPRLAPVVELLENASHYLEEAATHLQRYAPTVEGDPSLLEEIEARLFQIQGLKRKYRRSVEEILALGEELRRRVERMEGFEGEREDLAGRIEKTKGALARAVTALSEARKRTAKRLEREIGVEFREIGMGGTGLRVEVRQTGGEGPGPDEEGVFLEGNRVEASGIDRVEFLIRPNPGQPYLPLQRIASGGELSRIMLALRNVLRRAGGPPILVFDEVDAGIGGAEAEAVGARLKRLSRDFQVLCITHLPQIAVFGDVHLKVSKKTGKGRTSFGIRTLTGKERVREIARMLGGIRITDKTLAHAKEMLEQKASMEAR